MQQSTTSVFRDFFNDFYFEEGNDSSRSQKGKEKPVRIALLEGPASSGKTTFLKQQCYDILAQKTAAPQQLALCNAIYVDLQLVRDEK